MCSAKAHVRSYPESGHVRCTRDVRFVPIADIGLTRPMAQDARPKSKMRDPPTVECC